MRVESLEDVEANVKRLCGLASCLCPVVQVREEA